jgi:hypothetical protein
MMDQADITLLGIVAIMFVLSIVATRLALRRDGWTVQKYKLYAVRDRLIYLVATGMIQEDDHVFQRFYKAVNCYIEGTERINLVNFVAAAERARSKGIDPAEERNFRDLQIALRKKSPEVNEVANSFYFTILAILMENSLLLRVIWKCSSAATVLKSLAQILDRRETSKSAFRVFNDYSKAVAAQ